MDRDPTIERTVTQGLGDETIRFSEVTEPSARDSSAPALNRGSLIDRYVITDQLGAGGMGVVYAAYDPELDRRVAIKLLQPSLVGEGRPRLIREAQAIARIAHPNVVAVHDVGEFDGSVFVAMEFIDGRTLKKWLEAQPRTVPQIVDVFVQAGRGLAAAHAADLVHRDFKPDNVLVGRDGRVRVLDFGLARGRGSADSIGYHDGLSNASNLDEALTEVGTVMGTPAYMSPEQLAGHMATAASDQFAFCVALFEALYGVRPFAGKTMDELTQSVFAGVTRKPPPGRSAPAWLHRAVMQGLQKHHDDRFPSMEELVDELSVDRSRGRRRLVLAGAMAAGAVAVAILAYRSGTLRERSVCAAAADDMRAVWGKDRRKSMGAAFDALSLPHAKDTWDRVSAHVDEYASGWVEQSVSACEATHVDQTQSPDLLEKRRRCLGERLQRLDALLGVLADPSPPVVDRAVQSVSGLPDLHGCEDLAALEAGVAPPEQESTRVEVAAIREELVRAEALDDALRYQEQLEVLEPLLQRARATGYMPIEAGVQHTLARAQLSLDLAEGAESMRLAFRQSLAAGDDRRAAMAAVDLGHALGVGQRLHEQGEQWVDIAEALVQRMGGAPRIEIGMLNTRAILAIRQAHYDEALALFELLVTKQREMDPEDPNVAVGLMNLGSAYAERRDMEPARNYLQQAAEFTERVLGPKHPSITTIYANLSTIAMIQGRYEDAEQQLERTLALQREVLGADHLDYARSVAAMAIVQRNLGRPARSEQLHQEALDIRRAKLAPEHPEIAESLRNMAQAIIDQKRPEEALEVARRAQTIARERLAPEHPEHGINASMVAELLLEVNQPEKALDEAQQAIALLESKGRGPSSTLGARCTLGRAQRELGQRTASIATLEQALEIALAHSDSPGMLGRVRMELSKSSHAVGETDRARVLADQALQAMREAGAGYQRERERVERWHAQLQGAPADDTATPPG